MNADYINLTINFLKVSFLLLVVSVSVFVAQNSALIKHPLTASAITFDLLITLPVAYWFFIRKTKISKYTTVILITFGFILASFILPANNRQFFNYLQLFALPLIEIAAFAYVGLTIYRARKTYKTLIEKRKDFLEVLRETLAAEFPNPIVAKVFSFEIAAIYYAFLGWKARRGEHIFTYHKENGTAALLTVIGFVIAVETFVLHILIAKWSIAIAWVLSTFSIYFLFQIFAHGKAIFLRPNEIIENKLFVRCGLIGDAEIDLKNIESVETVSPNFEIEKNSIKLSPLGKFTACNLKISLHSEAILNGIYSRKRDFKTIFLAVDEAESLKEEIIKYSKNKI